MEDKQESSGWVAIFLASLVGLAAALFALVLRKARGAARGDQTQSSLSTSNVSGVPEALSEHQIPALAGTAHPAQAGSVRWTAPTKYIMSVVLFLVVLGVLFIGRAIIPMVLIAAILALFVNPFILMLTRKLRLKWTAAVALTYVLVILVLLLIPLLLFPNMVEAMNLIFNLDYEQLIDQAGQTIAGISASIQSVPVVNVVLVPLLNSLQAALENFASPAQVPSEQVTVTLATLVNQIVSRMGALVNVLSPVVTLVVSAFFTLLMAFQMSLASNHISGWYPDLIPPAYKEEYSALIEKITNTWISFLRGQLTLMLLIGVVVWLGGALLGVPFSLLMGVIAGLLEIIPSIGPTLAAIPAVLLAFVLGSTYLPIENNLVFALLVIGFYVIVQLIENQFVVPHIMGEAVDLPPIIVLIGALAGATAFGILGALLATPIIATGNLVFQYIYRKILEPPPLPPEPEEKPNIWERVKRIAGRIKLPGRKQAGAGEKVAVTDTHNLEQR